MKKAKLITSSAVVMTMVMSSIVPAFAYSKEETVYSKLKTNGSEKTTVVSEHLINDQNETSLDDQSSLKNIKNVNGKETFKQDGSSLVWQTTDGQDIYYQGKTTNSLPVSMKVTYKLDGKKTKLKDMLGKKGKVEIQIMKNKLLMVKNFMFLLSLQQEQCYQQKQILILKLQMVK